MAKKLTSQFRLHTILKQFKIWLQKLTCSSYQNNQITKIGGIISIHFITFFSTQLNVAVFVINKWSVEDIWNTL